MGRNVPLKIPAVDPLQLTEIAQAVLEIDRLFWLDPVNARQIQFVRKFVSGEEYPKLLPINEDGKAIRTSVLVQRWGRTFLVDGKPILLIEDNPPKQGKKITKAKTEPKTKGKGVLNEFRAFMAEYARQLHAERGSVRVPRPTGDERIAIQAKSRADQLARRAKKAATRSAIIEQKRAKNAISNG